VQAIPENHKWGLAKMSPLLKRIALVVLLPVLLAIGGWAQWSFFLNNRAPVETPVAEAPPVDVARITEAATAADPSNRPAPIREGRTAAGTTERPTSSAPPDELDTDPAQSQAPPPEARPEPTPAPAPAETREAPAPAAQEKQRAQEQEREAKRAQEEAETRKAAAAKREKAEKVERAEKPDRHDQGGGRSAFSYRERPSFPSRDAISPREVRAFIREHLDDLPARFRRPPPWARY